MSQYLSTPPLPETVSELLAQRLSARSRTINDEVEAAHLKLWDDKNYRILFAATRKEDTIEGSEHADDLSAARMIRDYARKNGLLLVSEEKLERVAKALRVVKNWYGIGRKQRKRQTHAAQISYFDNK